MNRRYTGDSFDGGHSGFEELGVEADLQVVARVLDGHGLVGFAHILGFRGHREGVVGEAQPEGSVLLGQEADAADGLEQLVVVDRHLVVERLRDQLPVVGELAVDEPGDQRDAADLEEHLVLGRQDGDGARRPAAARYARQLEQSARGDDRLESARAPKTHGSLLHAEAVAVGGDHAHRSSSRSG